MTARAKAGLLLSGIALVLGIGGFNRDCRDAVFGHDIPAMPTAQAGGPADPSRAVSALTGAHPYRGGN